jgi:hypothetical protein
LARFRRGELVGKYSERLADRVEDVEQRVLALGADAVHDVPGELLVTSRR